MKFKDYLNKKDISISRLSKGTGIPYATLHNGLEAPESIKLENLKKISKYLSISLDELSDMLITENTKLSILDLLKEQKNIKLKSNLYHNTQIRFAYNTNRIEGSNLTEDETRLIFETNTLIADSPSTNVNDIIEVANHFYLFDIMLDTAVETLSEKLIKKYHQILKNGTVDSRNVWFNIGDYKMHPNEVGGKMTTPPDKVQKEVKKLLSWYNLIEKITLEDIIDFHFKFEAIHPFQDGNGRIGRLIMFKESIANDIVPFIIEDEFKAYYYRGLSSYPEDKGYLRDTCLSMQDKYQDMIGKFLNMDYKS